MTKREVILGIPKGIHLRIAGGLAKKANEFESEIFIEHNNMNVNCKSVMGVAVLGAMTGDKLVVSANGKDEVKALLSVCSFLENDTEDKSENDIFNKYIIGASWMDTGGRLYIVKGFHQEWVEKNLSLLGEGVFTTNDVIEKLNWINIMVYKDKTIEFHVKDLSETVLERIESFLKDDSFFEWESAHIFTSQKESLYVQIEKNIFNENEKNLKNLLKENKLVTQYY